MGSEMCIRDRYYCFLKRIIDVGASQVADVSLGLFCIYSKNGGFAWTVVGPHPRPKMRGFDERSNNKLLEGQNRWTLCIFQHNLYWRYSAGRGPEMSLRMSQVVS